MLTFGGTTHVNPVVLRPAMRAYTIQVDGISKAMAATGLRVGWLAGPTDVVQRLSIILGHVGTWAPRPEQVGTAKLLGATAELRAFHEGMLRSMRARLDALDAGLRALAVEGFAVESIPPMGAIYLSARFPLVGTRLADGSVLESDEQVRRFLLDRAGLAVVPFRAFGVPADTGWFRLSAGAVSVADIDAMLPRLRDALRLTTGAGALTHA